MRFFQVLGGIVRIVFALLLVASAILKLTLPSPEDNWRKTQQEWREQGQKAREEDERRREEEKLRQLESQQQQRQLDELRRLRW